MSLLMRPLTYDDLEHMPDDGNRYELIGGELIVSPAPIRNHQKLSHRLQLLLGNHVAKHDLGDVYAAPVDVRLSRHNRVQPDLLFIRNDRRDIYGPTGPVEGAPDLVVEIISPSSRVMDRIRKAALYADAGVPEYWLVDPMERKVEMLVLEGGHYQAIGGDDGGLTSTVITGLVVVPETLFFELD